MNLDISGSTCSRITHDRRSNSHLQSVPISTTVAGYSFPLGVRTSVMSASLALSGSPGSNFLFNRFGAAGHFGESAGDFHHFRWYHGRKFPRRLTRATGISAYRQTLPDNCLVDPAASTAMGLLVGLADQNGQEMVADPCG